LSRPESADVRTHRMIYPNRKPLLISAILVALTSVPTLVVVAAGTVSLDGHNPPGSTAVGAPSDAPVIIEPGSSSGLQERPPSAGRAVETEPLVRALPRVVSTSGPLRGTARRLAPVVPAPVPAPTPIPTVQSPVPEQDVPSSAPASSSQPSPSSAPSDIPSDQVSRSRSSAQSDTPAEPRIDDRAWPGWDAHLPGG
jgi:hypothetical protein